MNIYHISLPEGSRVGYDEYDAAVVAAPDPESAAEIVSENCQGLRGNCKLIGESIEDEEGIILASFNAG